MLAMAQHRLPASYEDEHPEFKYLVQHNASVAFAGGFQNVNDNSIPRGDIHVPAYTSPPLQHCTAPNNYHTVASTPFSNLYNPFDSGSAFVEYNHVQERPRPRRVEQSPQQFASRNDAAGKPTARSSPNGPRPRTFRSATRSHSPHTRNEASSTRVSKPSRAKKANKNPSKTPQLDGPLSHLTKDMSIPVRDMEEWVTRPAEVRMKEVEKRNGYVTRPMNSFMLYRSAYAERTKQFCIQNNHQVVSAVSGQSWPKEPGSIREFYNNLARIERDNHASAHPTYKFSPTKATLAAASSVRKRFTSEPESDAEDSADEKDPDGDWVPLTGESEHARASPTPGSFGKKLRGATVPSSAGPKEYVFQQLMTVPSTLPPIRPLPELQPGNFDFQLPDAPNNSWQVAYDSQVMLDAHYQQQYNVQMQPYGPQQGHYFNPSLYYYGPTPLQNSYEQQSVMVGIPTVENYCSLHQQPSMTSMYEPGFQVDPMLLQFEHQQTPPIDDPVTPQDAMLAEDISPMGGTGHGFGGDSPTAIQKNVCAPPAGGLFDDTGAEIFFHAPGSLPSEFESLMAPRGVPPSP